MPSLVLIRGLPGAGKSTLAELLSENGLYPVYSVDSYFVSGAEKNYTFRFEDNHLAYKKCQDDTEQAMKNGVQKIFADNTFTVDWEMEPYFALAAAYGYRVFVITVENRHGGGNIHGTTREQLQKMAEKYKVVLL